MLWGTQGLYPLALPSPAPAYKINTLPAVPHCPTRAAQHGDAFTLRLLGQRMTFVFAPAALQCYFTAPDTLLTFAPAVQQVRGSTACGGAACCRWRNMGAAGSCCPLLVLS